MDITLNTSSLKITNEILGLIAEIDEFKGAWRAIGRIAPERLSSLRRVATIESVGSPAKIAGRRDDRDTLKGIEVKEVGIAGDDETGFTVDSKFEEFVVAGIAARADCVDNLDRLGDAAEETQKLLAFAAKPRLDVAAAPCEALDLPVNCANRRIETRRIAMYNH